MLTYSDYLKQFFPDFKVQKISVNAGLSCPNRDGTIGFKGCIYCRNDSFTPSYCLENDPISLQIEKGIKFFSRKYPEMKYLVYFQSYTGTHHRDINFLKKIYRDALSQDNVMGIVIGTRPDTLPDEVILMLAEFNREKPVFIEIGAESANDETLRRINRMHTWKDVEESVCKVSLKGLHCGLHLIAGLPGETENQIIESVKKTCSLPIETIKLHQLQILYGTPLFEMWKKGEIEVKPFSLDEYLKLCKKIINLVPPPIVIERFLAQSPPHLVAAPSWGIKNYQFMHLIQNSYN